MLENVNIEHLLDVFTSIDPDSDVIWDACCHFIDHLFWLKQWQTILRSKIEALLDDCQLKPRCFLILSELFASLGNLMEQKQLLTHTLELQRWQRDDFGAACTLQHLSDANLSLDCNKEGI